MKISDNMGRPQNIIEPAKSDDRKLIDQKSSAFQQYASRAEDMSMDERLASLVAQINEQGKKFEKKVDIRDLKKYRQLISDFLNEIVNGSHKFSKESFIDKRGRHRVFAIIRKINSELDVLTSDVLSGEKDNLKILQKIEDIRGLLLDIFM